MNLCKFVSNYSGILSIFHRNIKQTFRNAPVDIKHRDQLEISAIFPSRNSMIAFKLRESARASSQKSLARPHPSCNSTRMASSSSLQTVRRWFRVFRLKCKKRSQSPHNDWHVSHWIIAAVTPSSWFEHNGRVSDIFDHCPDDNLNEFKVYIANEFIIVNFDLIWNFFLKMIGKTCISNSNN